MSKISKILILVLIIGGMLSFSLSFQIFQGTAQEELPIFVKLPEKIEKPLYVSDEIIVKFKLGIAKDLIGKLLTDQGVLEKYESKFTKFKVLKIPAGKLVTEMVDFFKKSPLVEYAEPNYYRYSLWYPNDPYYKYQWHFDDDHTNNPGGASSNPYGGLNGGGIRMEEAWPITSGTSTIKVAIVDTGVAYENYGRYCQAPDLASTTFVAGYDFVNGDTHPNDDNGHGTHVAGTVAQSTHNNLGVAGIAFNTAIMPVKVLDRGGSGTDDQVANGIRFAVDNGAKVINLSLGGAATSTTLESAVKYAYDNGAMVIAAAGNEGDTYNQPSYPAAYDAYVIAVGATRYDETRSYYSNYGSYLDLVAPGGQLYIQGTNTMLDQNEDGYWDGVLQQTFSGFPHFCDFAYYFFYGTSMAAPHVSGVAALLLAQDSTRTPTQIRNILQSTAEDKGATGWDQYYGWGLIDAYAALTYSPAVSISLTTDGLVEFGIVALGATVDSSGDVQTVRVDTGPANLDVRSTVFSTSTYTWNLGASNGPNQVKWGFSTTTTGSWSTFLAPNTLYDLANNVSQGTTQNLYLRLTMPTETSSTNQYSSIVTIVATAP